MNKPINKSITFKSKLAVGIIILSVIFSCLYTMPAEAAAKYTVLKSSAYAKVVEVIDGEAIIAELSATGEYVLCRLIGVDSMANTQALDYATLMLLGKNVTLYLDSKIPSGGKWNFVYVYPSEYYNFNAAMIRLGYAKVNTDHNKCGQYATLLKNEKEARDYSRIVWANPSNDVSAASLVNINTATRQELIDNMEGVTGRIASNIISYREENPFNIISEIKFVTGFTAELYEKNRYAITIGYSNDVEISLPSQRANVNTATKKQLTEVGLSSSQADKILNARKNYGFKNFSELAYELSLSKTDQDKLQDNLTFKTDINYAEESELTSLFGDIKTPSVPVQALINKRPYNAVIDLKDILPNYYYTIEQFCYTDYAYVDEHVNLHTATREQLTELGFSSTQITSIFSARTSYIYAKNLPFNLLDYNISQGVTLMTDINTASIDELMSLNAKITRSIALDIINYRNNAPFGTKEEFNSFLKSKGMGEVYEAVRDIVGVR